MKPPLRIMENPDEYSSLCCIVDCSNDEFVCDSVFPHDAVYIIACVNACHKAGLTVGQLEQDAIGKAIEHLKWIKGNLERYGADAGLVEISYRITDALRPFTPEAK